VLEVLSSVAVAFAGSSTAVGASAVGAFAGSSVGPGPLFTLPQSPSHPPPPPHPPPSSSHPPPSHLLSSVFLVAVFFAFSAY
jgi:hypothetical protein